MMRPRQILDVGSVSVGWFSPKIGEFPFSNWLQSMSTPKHSPQQLADLRKDYAQASLDIQDVQPDPVDQFKSWFKEALDSEVLEPNAMTLCTIDPDGRPSGRIVLIKGIDAQGVSFFTNYQSRKGQALAANPFASLVFFWPELERQVRIDGRVSKVSAAESEEYYRSRPKAKSSPIGSGWSFDKRHCKPTSQPRAPWILPAPNTGVATGFSPTSLSSGRVAHQDFMTESATGR
jgi:pyridoxamine-phosphate oxidase